MARSEQHQESRFELWSLQIPGWLLFMYLVYAQGIPAFDYELGVRMGTQESAQNITEVGAAFWYGFAFADLVIYIPLLAAGLVGHWLGSTWSRAILGAMGPGRDRTAIRQPTRY